MGERQFAPGRGLPVYVAVQFDCRIASLNAASVKDRYVALRSHSARSRQPSAIRPIEASKDAVCYVHFTSTPAVREASSASFDMIRFRLIDHDGCDGQEPSS
jgi:hypothetical protein